MDNQNSDQDSLQIALIHKDLRIITEKLETLTLAVSNLTVIDKTVYSHTIALQAIEKRMIDNEKSAADRETRIRALEQWRWYVVGGIVVTLFFASGIPWKLTLAG